MPQLRAFPTRSPMPSLGGFSQGLAENSAASLDAPGEKYAVVAFAFRSCCENTAMAGGWPDAANIGENIF